PGSALRLREQVTVDVQRRSHADEYALCVCLVKCSSCGEPCPQEWIAPRFSARTVARSLPDQKTQRMDTAFIDRVVAVPAPCPPSASREGWRDPISLDTLHECGAHWRRRRSARFSARFGIALC